MYINHHNPDLFLLTEDGSEVMKIDLTRLSSIASIHRLMSLLGLREICGDADERCAGWSSKGECDRNEGFMHTNCRKACGLCAEGAKQAEGTLCTDAESANNCQYWSTMGECTANEAFMREKCARACGFCKVSFSEDDAAEKDEL